MIKKRNLGMGKSATNKKVISEKEAPIVDGNTVEEQTKKGKIKQGWDKFRSSIWITIALTILVPALAIFTCEWVIRFFYIGKNEEMTVFQAIAGTPNAFIISYLLLLSIYIIISQLTRLHAIAVAVVGLFANTLGIVSYFKLVLRNEIFLPWDIYQVGDLLAINEKVTYEIPACVIITVIIFVVLIIFSCFIKMPKWQKNKKILLQIFIPTGISAIVVSYLFFGVFLVKDGGKKFGLVENQFSPNGYYVTNGAVYGFMSNLYLLKIQEPAGYSEKAVLAIEQETLENISTMPLYPNSYVAVSDDIVETPDIIFVQAEAFWDMRNLDMIEYDRELMSNFDRLVEESATGNLYTPSFGGGTCDVEFEVLTGFSMENLPSGSKPYQQYINQNYFSLPQYLRADKGYDTLAIHGYGNQFWNRHIAYPRLGFNEFIASDTAEWDPIVYRRGFISDETMVARIIEEYEKRESDSAPMFIHAVTMQNHSGYSADKYPDDERVKILSAPDVLTEQQIGQLEDSATGIYEMDLALGTLVDYLKTTDRPTILVFWGDHLNPVTNSMDFFQQTGLIEEDDPSDPLLFQTPLMIWSNYSDQKVDLGIVGANYISPVFMDMYGLEKPFMFEYLTEQFPFYHARNRGIIVEPDNTYSTEMTPEQQEWFDKYAILQYDFMFGNKTLENYAPEESAIRVALEAK